RATLERHVPGSVEEADARERLAGVSHEQLEQRELLRRELELGVAAPRAVRGRIEPQVVDLEQRRPLAGRAADERPQPRNQLRERERLHEVIVPAGVEPLDAVVYGV